MRKSDVTSRDMARSGLVAVALLAGAAALPASAEQLPPAAVDSKACGPGERLRPDVADGTVKAPPQTTGEHLSDQLARTDGVLCPPKVDPDIRTPAPGSGRTPVIPPPTADDPETRPK
jgi:hypothetical protein